MSARTVFVLIAVAVLAFAASLVFFVVREDQQAIVLQFGDPRRVIENDAGIYAKVPFAQSVVYLDDRNLEFDLRRPVEIIVANEERLLVDAFVRYEIDDPLQYYQRLSSGGRGTQDMRDAFDNRLTTILNEAMRQVLGEVQIRDIITARRVELMQAIQTSVAQDARQLGVEIIDVRIRQADFPEQNANQVYERMRTDYAQQAARIRADGERRARETRAQAEKEVVTIRAEAEEEAQRIRGRADGERNRIFAEAYTRDPEFFAFYRSLTAYEAALGDDETTIILSPDTEFFRYFEDIQGAR